MYTNTCIVTLYQVVFFDIAQSYNHCPGILFYVRLSLTIIAWKVICLVSRENLFEIVRFLCFRATARKLGFRATARKPIWNCSFLLGFRATARKPIWIFVSPFSRWDFSDKKTIVSCQAQNDFIFCILGMPTLEYRRWRKNIITNWFSIELLVINVHTYALRNQSITLNELYAWRYIAQSIPHTEQTICMYIISPPAVADVNTHISSSSVWYYVIGDRNPHEPRTHRSRSQKYNRPNQNNAPRDLAILWIY